MMKDFIQLALVLQYTSSTHPPGNLHGSEIPGRIPAHLPAALMRDLAQVAHFRRSGARSDDVAAHR
jgi:hypothetical protein